MEKGGVEKRACSWAPRCASSNHCCLISLQHTNPNVTLSLCPGVGGGLSITGSPGNSPLALLFVWVDLSQPSGLSETKSPLKQKVPYQVYD